MTIYHLFEDMEGNEILPGLSGTYEVKQTLVDSTVGDPDNDIIFTYRITPYRPELTADL